ncbi:MAG TPA: hypothetical protein VHJ78_12150 [Actinomycetota bacterium]|nr:hypothetical protein [Actinomycetota bacterium]
MTNPQQPELARNRKGNTDQSARELTASETNPMQPEPFGKIPDENQPGHHPDQEQDKPQGPPG